MPSTVVLELGPTRSRLVRPSPQARKIVDGLLSCFKKGYRYSPRYPRHWDGKVHLLKADNSFPTGLHHRIAAELERKKYTVQVKDKRAPRVRSVLPLSIHGRDDEDSRTVLQDILIDEAIKAGSGLLSAATGVGKTEIISGLLQRLNAGGLVVTHKTDLLEQTRERVAERLRLPLREIGAVGNQKNVRKQITVATFQTIHAHLDAPRLARQALLRARKARKPTKTLARLNTLLLAAPARAAAMREWLETFSVVIGDECHHLAAKTFYEVMNACPARDRYGVSATVFKSADPDEQPDPETELKIVGVFGEVIAAYGGKHAVASKMLVKAPVRMHNWHGGKPTENWDSDHFAIDDEAIPFHQLHAAAICGLPVFSEKGKRIWKEATELGRKRNDRIVKLTKRLVKRGRPTLILLERIEHGDALALRLTKELGFTVPFLHGTDGTDVRRQALRDIADGTLKVIIANTIFDEGVDAPAISGLIMAGGGKAIQRLVQRLGRGMRKSKGKYKLVVYDLFDTHSRVLWRQSKARHRGYKKMKVGSVKIVRSK